MDLNLKIIEAVKNSPSLYKNKATLAEREDGWRLIAEQVKIQEQLLKSRWHFLREHYQRDCKNTTRSSQFVYKKQMEFLEPFLRQSPEKQINSSDEMVLDNVIKPEFIITEKDCDNDSGTDEYVFLEVEALEGSSEEENVKSSQEEGQEQQQQKDVKLEEKFVESNQVKAETVPRAEEIENNKILQQPAADVEKPVPLKKDEIVCKPDNPCEIINNDTQMKAEKTQNSDKAKIEENTAQSSDEIVAAIPAKFHNERCEDTIFGELVTAMLRPMPSEKKRAIKKDIMNLLLT